MPVQSAPHLVASISLTALLLTAAWTDARTRKIPNWLVVAGLTAAFVLRASIGIGGVRDGLLGAAVAFAIALPLFAMGALGAGDGKLLIAVGAFLGPAMLLPAGLAIAIAGGVIAFAMALWQRTLLPVLQSAWGLLQYLVSMGRAGHLPPAGTARNDGIPYGVPIAIGTLAVWFFGGWSV